MSHRNTKAALIELHPAGEAAGGFRVECAGGAVGVVPASDRLTPDGGAAAWSHSLEKIGVVADLAQRFPVPRTSPNATPVADVLQAFMFNCLMGGQRFAHARRVQDDRAVAVILGLKKGRMCGEDAFARRIAADASATNAGSVRWGLGCSTDSRRAGSVCAQVCSLAHKGRRVASVR